VSRNIYPVSGVILAGGKSKRFGGKVNKAFLLLENKPIIQWIIEKISPLLDEIIVVTNKEKEFKELPVKLVKDIYPGYGSLSGLHSGLFHAQNFYSFICACDSPFIRPGLVNYLIKKKKKYDVVIPWLKSGQQPFCALYSKNCLQPIVEVMGEKTNPKIIDFFAQVNVCKINETEIKKVDPQLISFFNINTWSDFKQAEILARKEKKKQV
jgi:molybdopterin-guanine dinucleotide biosynthesis protein A